MNLFKNKYFIYVFALGLLNLLPFLAPIFLAMSESMPFFHWPAKVIYFIYSFTCHQFHHRSLHIHDHQCAWCSRDVAIWSGVFLGALFTGLLGVKKGIKWYWVIPFVIPIALDGGIQTLAQLQNPEMPFYVSNNFVRYLTGGIFGVGLSLWVSPKFLEWLGGEYYTQTAWLLRNDPWKFRKPLWEALRDSMFKLSSFLVALLLVFYAFMVTIWSLTSTKYLPTDFLDTAVKNEDKDIFARRETAICPTTGTDLFNWECFLGR